MYIGVVGLRNYACIVFESEFFLQLAFQHFNFAPRFSSCEF